MTTNQTIRTILKMVFFFLIASYSQIGYARNVVITHIGNTFYIELEESSTQIPFSLEVTKVSDITPAAIAKTIIYFLEKTPNIDALSIIISHADVFIDEELGHIMMAIQVLSLEKKCAHKKITGILQNTNTIEGSKKPKLAPEPSSTNTQTNSSLKNPKKSRRLTMLNGEITEDFSTEEIDEPEILHPFHSPTTVLLPEYLENDDPNALGTGDNIMKAIEKIDTQEILIPSNSRVNLKPRTTASPQALPASSLSRPLPQPPHSPSTQPQSISSLTTLAITTAAMPTTTTTTTSAFRSQAPSGPQIPAQSQERLRSYTSNTNNYTTNQQPLTIKLPRATATTLNSVPIAPPQSISSSTRPLIDPNAARSTRAQTLPQQALPVAQPPSQRPLPQPPLHTANSVQLLIIQQHNNILPANIIPNNNILSPSSK